MKLTGRQERIVEIVKDLGPISSGRIAQKLNLTRGALRPDLAILTMAGILEARPKVGYFYSGKSPQTVVAEHILGLRVRDLKSVPVVVSQQATVYDSIVTMFVEDVGTLFVVAEGGNLEGVVSRKDLLKAAMGNTNLKAMPVTVIMTRRPHIVTITADDTVYAAAKKLIDNEVDALPVVRVVGPGGQEKTEVVGRITKTTITRLFVELGEGK